MKALELQVTQNVAESIAAGQRQQIVYPFSWGGGTPIPCQSDTLKFCVNGHALEVGSFTCSGSWFIELRTTRSGARKMKITGAGAAALGDVARAEGFENSDELFAWVGREYGLPFDGILLRWTN